jgi:hypothetical protein
MSYKQAMKWARRHPKGTRQPLIFSTGGSWPAPWCNLCDRHLRECYCADLIDNGRAAGCDLQSMRDAIAGER